MFSPRRASVEEGVQKVLPELATPNPRGRVEREWWGEERVNEKEETTTSIGFSFQVAE